MPEAWFLAEYFGVFTDAEGSFFSYEQVMGALSDAVHPLFAPVVDHIPENGRASIDFSTLLVR